jgi:hypothetical protein
LSKGFQNYSPQNIAKADGVEMERTGKPNFFIAGMPRSGTTSMYIYLKQHPEIYLSIYKEPHFFGKDLTSTIYGIRSAEIYATLFAGAGGKKRIGEASVWTMASKTAAVEINAFDPSAKILIMLRNPLDMIYSLHGLYLRTGNEDIPDFQRALEVEPERRNGRSLPQTCYFPEGLLYTEVAKYHEKIRRFVEVFTGKNIHVVLFDDFIKDTLSCCRGVFAFLGVDPGNPVELDLKKALAVIRPLVLKQLRHAHPEVKKRVALKPDEIHLGAPRPSLPQNLRSRLQRLFKEDIEKTGQLIGKNLNPWIQ